MKAKPKIRVVVPYPNSGAIHPRCQASLDALAACDKVEAAVVTARGSSISYNRNIGIIGHNPPTVKQSNFDFDYVLSVDADIAFTVDDVLRLLARDVDIVSGAYTARADCEKYVAGHLREAPRGRPVSHLPVGAFKGCLPVDWVGAGFTLIKRSVFEQVKFPYYCERVMPYTNDDGEDCAEWVGEDIGFSINAREEGFGIYVDCDVVVEHITEYPAATGLGERLKNLKILAGKIEADTKACNAKLEELAAKRLMVRANIMLLEELTAQEAGAAVRKPSKEAVDYVP